MGRRKGFILADINHGAGIRMWKAMNKAFSSSSDDALFVFPGGRIDFKNGNEYLRNAIYDLASGNNIDDVIIWASSLAGAVGKDTIADFVREKASSIPVVAIGMRIDGIASVDFDAYSGMACEISHFINEHKQRRIAFLRGPATHESAEERYRAYCDELEKAGIPYDDALVSSPHPWAEGEASIKELVAERGLIPGKDFTALVAASDLILLGAQDYLVSSGVRIPEDIITGSFNGNEENILMSPEPTTVLMPIDALARTAYSLSGKDLDSYIKLPAVLDVKDSCGCSGKIVSKDAFLSSLDRRIADDGLRALTLEIFDEAEAGSHGLPRIIGEFIGAGGDSTILSQYASFLDDRSIFYDAIVKAERKSNAIERVRTRQYAHILDEFKNSLLATRSFRDLSPIMARIFPSLGIRRAFLVLYRDFSQSELRAGFSSAGLFSDSVFPRSGLLPEVLSGEIEKGIFVVEPLYYDNQELGYLILEAAEANVTLIEDIRAAVSSSVRSMMLFDEIRDAKDAAEKGEQAALDFYSKVSDGIRQSLSEIRRKLLDDRVSPQSISDTIVGAENLLELSLAEYEDVEFEKRFVNASSIADDAISSGISAGDIPKSLPSVEADRKLLGKAFSVVSYLMGGNARLSVYLAPSSICFIIEGRISITDRNSVLLVEKYAIIHSGSAVFADDSVTIKLPYPAFSGNSASSDAGGSIIYISSGDYDAVPDALLPLSPLTVPASNLSDLLSVSSHLQAVSWTSSGEKETSFIVNLLRSHRNTKNIPCICFGSDAEAISFRSALEGKELPASTAILALGNVNVPPILGEYGTITHVSSFEEASGAAGDVRMILMEGLSYEMISKFRKNHRFATVPIVSVCDSLADSGAENMEEIPNLIVVNTSILDASGFVSRLIAIMAGSSLLPPLTGIIVKRAVVYMNRWARRPITRWKIADAVNISEDYLTRIFRKEIGISPWDYLNRYRIQLASTLLTGTGMSMSEVAHETGFQDQAYFCRVFKKIKGISPRQLRKHG